MKVEVIPTLYEIRADHIWHKTVIIIDVLRSTSTIVAALAHGFLEVIPVETIGAAKSLKGEGRVLAGERYCKKIPGFTISNSPLEAKGTFPGAKTLVLTTTNGTRAIHKSLKASDVYIASFLNATACASAAVSTKRDITLVCAGTRNEFALEDGLCAGLLIHTILQFVPQCEVSDLGVALSAAYSSLQSDLTDTLMNTLTGRRLTALGLSKDIEFCAQVDRYPLVPLVKEDRIIPWQRT